MAHNHSHSTTKNIKVAFFLNVGFTILEIIGGFLTNSTAILADAVHDLGDSFALAQAWYFEKLAEKKGDTKYTFGYKRFSLLGALISTILLFLSSLYILSEAIPRINNPEHSNAKGMLILAILGIVVNAYAMFKLTKEKGMNARVVGLHLLEDVLGWIAVFTVAIILLFKDIHILDPILAVLITLYILSNVLKNLKNEVSIILQGSPENIDIKELEVELKAIELVSNVHHTHIWSLDGENNVFTTHLIVDEEINFEQQVKIREQLKTIINRYGFYHSTVEIEFSDEECRISSDVKCN